MKAAIINGGGVICAAVGTAPKRGDITNEHKRQNRVSSLIHLDLRTEQPVYSKTKNLESCLKHDKRGIDIMTIIMVYYI